MGPILICTPTVDEDPCVTGVVRALRGMGREAWVLATTRFPGEVPFSLRLDEGTHLHMDGRDLAGLQSVWLRATRFGWPEGMDPVHLQAAETQANAAFWSMIECLDCFLLDPPEAAAGAGHKPSLGRLARACGLRIPRTLVSNDPDAVRAFAATCPQGIVYKLIDSGSISLEQGDDTRSYPTRRLPPEALDDLQGLEIGPMIFQEEIEKALELRITVVGPQLFVGAIDAAGVVDVRERPDLMGGYRPWPHLPAAVEAALQRLVDRLGLNFASIDLIVTPDERFVFLELNTVSWYDHVERSAGLPISEAVAALLAGETRPRGRRRNWA
jgi:glutathione synthase/RimK-type ligase-like ATP-grasp enzyme